jgi:acyl CoA:acetate/3-ketoacid CoA transferase alpha subunit/acyl CoA:acetate/3-ketoacid CoA transferase beta subunit
MPGALAERFALRENEGSSKVTSLHDAVRAHVRPHDTVHVAYSDARPNAALMELARAFAGTPAHLTLVTAGLVNIQHCLVELGIVDRLIASFVGENYPVARPNPAVVRAVAERRLTIESWSLWTLIARLAAGALGVSHFPVRSLAGSSIAAEAAERGEYVEAALGGGEPAGFVAALRPDVVVLQGAAADRHGNVVPAAPYGEGMWGSLAARRGVIACVEKIVSTAEIRAMNTLVRIPAQVTLAVCEVPYGSHPYGLNSPGIADVTSYVEDEDFVGATLRACREPDQFRAWIDQWVLGVADHDAYLARLGPQRLAALRGISAPDDWQAEYQPSWLPDQPASRLETQVIATARQLRRRVRVGHHQAILAGVGLSNLAAWVGAERLHAEGVDVELMAEIGLFGYSPRPGEPFIFSSRNTPTSKMLTDVMTVLGTLVSGQGTRSIGVIGAGQLDGRGAINSTYTAAGDFIVGSGGANDVLTAADEVVVTVSHSRERLVNELPYVTCPGDKVRSVVTDLAVFERSGAGAFVLTRCLGGSGSQERETVALIQSRTGWDFEVAPELEFETPPTPSELQALRVFDPKLIFLRDRKAL